mmetsp:Transcript_7403/g.18684  ORF Transcript_7403/g.18684 Transcript_7403/m.18684 type:complete len:206 (+) Transcript_7403:1215-1832(+)
MKSQKPTHLDQQQNLREVWCRILDPDILHPRRRHRGGHRGVATGRQRSVWRGFRRPRRYEERGVGGILKFLEQESRNSKGLDADGDADEAWKAHSKRCRRRSSPTPNIGDHLNETSDLLADIEHTPHFHEGALVWSLHRLPPGLIRICKRCPFLSGRQAAGGVHHSFSPKAQKSLYISHQQLGIPPGGPRLRALRCPTPGVDLQA